MIDDIMITLAGACVSPWISFLTLLYYTPFSPYDIAKNVRNELITPAGRTGAAIRKSIETQMAEWGDGSRGIVRVQWQKKNYGHVFIAEQVNGKTRFIDPQNGAIDVTHYFDSV